MTHTGEGQFGRNLNISECRTQANRCHTSHDKKNPAAHTPINSNPLYFFLKLQMAEKDSPFTPLGAETAALLVDPAAWTRRSPTLCFEITLYIRWTLVGRRPRAHNLLI